MSDMTAAKAAALRKPFPPASIGKLPKGGTMLDFCGHAAVTDRLLAVDPEWSWEPMATDERGLPALDSRGNLWIRLTICGVTRIGVGDGKSAKEVIGDAIRNGAMRFGVALDLWAKEDLLAFADASTQTDAGPVQRPGPVSHDDDRMVTRPQLAKLAAQMRDLGITERDEALDKVAGFIGREVTSRNELTKQEATRVIEGLALQLGGSSDA